jgi:lipopolysaccharide export system protein LptA
MVREGLKKQVSKELEKAKRDPALSRIQVSGDKNTFVVSDTDGRPLIEAKVDRIDGAMRPDQGIQGPVQMRKAKCRLYQKGKPQMDLVAPEATWDGKQLVAGKTAHGTTTDGGMVLDAQKAVWTADNGILMLDGANVQSLEKGKTTFTADAPKAEVNGNIITMPAGGIGRNPEGQRLKADHVRWFRDTRKLQAEGHVVVSEPGTQVTGHRLVADTRLKKGKFSGGARIQARSGKLPFAKAQ